MEPEPITPEPTIPLALLRRLTHLFTPAQLAQLVHHAEQAEANQYGQLFVDWRGGRIDVIGHQVSDKIRD